MSNFVKTLFDPKTAWSSAVPQLAYLKSRGEPTTSRGLLDPLQAFSHPPPPQLPGAPTMDTAANAAAQSADQMRRRRGVYANIYAGGAAQPAPTVSQKSLLGT